MIWSTRALGKEVHGETKPKNRHDHTAAPYYFTSEQIKGNETRPQQSIRQYSPPGKNLSSSRAPPTQAEKTNTFFFLTIRPLSIIALASNQPGIMGE